MSYATTTALLTRFGAEEIAQRVDRGTPRVVTAALLTLAAAGGDLTGQPVDTIARITAAMMVIDRAITDADSTIDGYISSRYKLPLWPVPPVLDRIACDLARYFLFGDQVTEAIGKRYDAGVKVLQDVSRGNVQLGADPVSGDQPASTSGAELVTGDRVWNRESSRGFL